MDQQPELCPFHCRRTARELFVKLFVVNFTVMYAYAHLLRARNEPRIILRVILCFLCPLLSIWVAFFPVMAIAYTAITNRGNRAKTKEVISQVLGEFPDVGEADGDTAAPLPKAHRPVTHAHTEKKPETGQIFGALALLTQCIGSIWLYHRRTARNAVIDYDKRILQLAIAGICIGFCLLVQAVPLPPYPPRNTSWTNVFRPPKSRSAVRAIWCSFLDAVVASSAFRAFSFAGLTMPSRHDPGIASDFVYNMGHKPYYAITVGCVLAISITLPGSILYCADSRRARGWDSLMKAYVYCLVCLACAVSGLLIGFWFKVLVETGLMDYIVMGFPMPLQLKALPVDQACPQAWSDPYAEWIWWLA